MTIVELFEWLKTLDEVYLLELLDVQSDEIVDRFGDRIEERYTQLVGEKELMK